MQPSQVEGELQTRDIYYILKVYVYAHAEEQGTCKDPRIASDGSKRKSQNNCCTVFCVIQ